MSVLAGNYPQQNGRTTPPPDRLTLVNGRPETIALKYPTGKQVNSQYGGAQMMYTLSDGRRAYFPLEVGQEIDALRLAPGQPFTICKHNARDWQVDYAAGVTASERQYAHSSEAAAVNPPERIPAPRPQPVPRPTPPPRPSLPPAAHIPASNTPAGRVNGAGEDVATIMARCYQDAIAIALGAVEHARRNGLMITPSFEDVRCIAATLCINETGGRK